LAAVSAAGVALGPSFSMLQAHSGQYATVVAVTPLVAITIVFGIRVIQKTRLGRTLRRERARIALLIDALPAPVPSISRRGTHDLAPDVAVEITEPRLAHVGPT
jgi:hypothetical protein